MSDKFKKVPVDNDTRILFEKETKLEGYDILHQLWSWDGLLGGSVILANEDLEESENQKIIEMLKTSEFVPNDVAIEANRSDCGFTFFSFDRSDLKDD